MMDPMEPLPIPFNPRSATPCSRYFTRVESSSNTSGNDDTTTHESDLLKSIRNALRGTQGEPSSHTTSVVFPQTRGSSDEDELCWDTHTLFLSSGGVIRKKWNFEGEAQTIQWACVGWFEQPSTLASPSSARSVHYTSSDIQDETVLPDPRQRPTFGPFTRAERERGLSKDTTTRYRAVFVFLRGLGRIFFMNGLEYTFYLPFIVRKAWPLAPHGVVVQRLLEPGEFEEAAVSKDEPLPTTFAITDPFAEASAVGLTADIRFGRPTALEDHEPGTPIATIPAQEHLVWVSGHEEHPLEQLALTMNMERNELSVWCYTYMDPREEAEQMANKKRRACVVPPQAQAQQKHSRQSLSLSGQHPMSPRMSAAPPPSFISSFSDQPPLAALPGMQPALNASMAMSALLPGATASAPQAKPVSRGRRNSLGQYDAPSAPVGGRIEGSMLNVDPVDSARMRPAYWIQRLYSEEIMAADVAAWRDITTATYDRRGDGRTERIVFAVCLPRSQTLLLLPLHLELTGELALEPCIRLNALAIAPVKAIRSSISDLLQLKPDGSLSLLTHGVHELPVQFKDVAGARVAVPQKGQILSLKDGIESSVTLCMRGGTSTRITLDLYSSDDLTRQSLSVLAMVLPKDAFFKFHCCFLQRWSNRHFVDGPVAFDALREAIDLTLCLESASTTPSKSSPWDALKSSRSASRFSGDPVLRNLALVPTPSPADAKSTARQPRENHVNVLNGLHYLAQNMLLSVDKHTALLRLVPVICRLALVVRPEWADYWKRLIPDALDAWPVPATAILPFLDDRLPVSPPDVFSTLYGRLNNPEWNAPEISTASLILPKGTEPSYAFGTEDPLSRLHHVTAIYRSLSLPNTTLDYRKRAEGALKLMVQELEAGRGCVMDKMPLGLAAPLREAARTCQLSPAGDWPITAYRLIQRNDLAEGISSPPDLLTSHGYRSVRDYLLPTFNRVSIHALNDGVRKMVAGELSTVTGVELGLEDFTDIRFGQDKRLEEVARMLCSSTIPFIRMPERPELGEFDTSREYQNHIARLAERTLALPMGRGVFTFGSVQVVTREAYAIPRMEYSLRLYPQNVHVNPEMGKIPMESLQWGNFHNGVAAGLRISPTAHGVESSWIKFNKPTDLSAEHAGFLFALGLTGHLREMLTWHTFSYLTPKHDFTSIAVLLGLSAANVGNSNRHVTKLLAVHTPALLPTPTVDLNVPMITQAAGLSGIGLLYMGTKNRRMAEVCLSQLNRRDLIQPDVTNEYREAYTLCAAIAFGMVMLGKGSDVPADLVLLSRLRALIHGEGYALSGVKPSRASFDVNLTSPAATIALGFMYLRTERQDVADILTIPDTIVNLEKVPPGQLLLRTLARSLIMWDGIAATSEWVYRQVPVTIAAAVDRKLKEGKEVDSTYDLAYWNIIAGACFAIGLKFAGTAAEEAYGLLLRHFDTFSHIAYSQGPLFEHRIRRAAIRDGLNIISISLSLIMAGTGEIHCLRRFRYAYGLYTHQLRYGTYGAIHASIGMLFLGGGRYTLGTSDAAIAALVTAFFPRFAQVSSDNRSYLQALRHLWVLAVEPRCLVARDVDTKEVVYLPVKLKVKDGKDVGASQLIAPTLIPDVDRVLSLRIDTPRYWPFYLDIANFPHHKEALIRSQTLYVKRRTAFLSYMEDPKGSRSLFVRSGAGATGDAATLDFPRLKDPSVQAPTDLHQFISSYSNDPLFLAFADRFCRDLDGLDDERRFSLYCHAALMDGILQDKSHSMQAHLTLYHYRRLPMGSPLFGIAQQDLRFMAEFYGRIFERRFSGRPENNYRPPLVRESTLNAALYEQDLKLEVLHKAAPFTAALRQYARGAGFEDFESPASQNVSRVLSWYLQRNNVPVSTILVILKALAVASHARCLEGLPSHNRQDTSVLDAGIKEVLHATGSQMTISIGAGWSIRSVEEILTTWSMGESGVAATKRS